MDERDQYMNKQENVEQSRVLWSILSVLTVIAISIGAAIFFFFPSSDGEGSQPMLSSMNSEKQNSDFDPIEYVRNDDGYPQMVDPETINEEYSVDSSQEDPAVADTPQIETVEEESAVIEVTPVKTEPVKVVKPVAVPVVKKTELKKISVTVYWIQVGSYSALVKAEEVRDYLLTKDISSEIQTKAVDGKTYYRVRIGTFQSKGEADRFLNPIKELENFEESYVVQTTMVREVPVN